MIKYHITDLGELPNNNYDQSKPVGINNSGQVVGSWYSFDGTVDSRGFVGSAQVAPFGIGNIAGRKSNAKDINENGIVLGGHWKKESPESIHDGVYLYDYATQTTTDISSAIKQAIDFERIYPKAINNNGVIIGSLVTSQGQEYKNFRFDTTNNQFTIIPYQHFVNDINGNNIIVGNGTSAIYFDGVVHEINGSENGSASAINEDNWVVGSTEQEAFLYDIGTQSLKKLETLEGPWTLGGPTSIALGVNSNRQVVGQSTYQLRPTAFIYKDSANAKMHNLNDRLIAANGWYLTAASDINDNGSIIGYGSINYGKDRAFLLTPVEVPPEFETPTPKYYATIAEILFGVIGDGGGGVFVGGKFKRIPPGDPPPEFDILLGIAMNRIAKLMSGQESVALQKATMDMIIKIAKEELKRIESKR